MKAEIQIFDANKISSELLNDFDGQVDKIFVANEGSDEQWSQPSWYVFYFLDGKWVSAATLHKRTISVDSRQIDVIGVGTVMTLPSYKGQGYSSEVMKAAKTFACGSGTYACMMLFCMPKMVNFFASLGWQKITAPIVYTTSTGTKTMTKYVSMVCFCNQDSSWSDYDVNLCGLPW